MCTVNTQVSVYIAQTDRSRNPKEELQIRRNNRDSSEMNFISQLKHIL